MPSDSGRPSSKLKRALFFTGMLLLPVALFALVELGLRVGGFGESYPLFAEVPGYPDYLQPNPDVGRRYFSRTSVVPSPLADAFRREKEPGTYRIVVQGASTAAGFPYGHGGSFSRMLQQRLSRTFPGRRIEVVNTSMAAVNSYTLADLVDEIVEQQPDALLIYAGHNEFYGALGVGSTESIGPVHTLVRMYLAIDHVRIVQAVRRLWVRLLAGRPTGRAPGATLMEEMARERSIPLGSPTYHRGIEQFDANLRDVLCRYRGAGIPVFISTVASNERNQPPFDSGLAASTDPRGWEAAFSRANRLAADGDTTAATTMLDALIGMDSLAADAFYARARIREGAGRLAEARADYLAAKDRDRLRFRAPEAINAVIRDVAGACGARIVDTQRALADASPIGIIGKEVMLEHLHPNVDGYFVMSDAFYRALRDADEIGTWERTVPPDVARRTVLVTPLDTTLASLHVRRLRNNWPFQPPGVTRPDTLRADTPLAVLALDVLQGKQSWLSAMAASGALFEQRGDYDEAFRVALALIQEEPYRDQPYLLAGNVLIKQGRFAAAYSYFAEAEARRPSAEARRMMGHALLRSGRPRDAMPHLHGALAIESDYEPALYDLAVAFAETGRLDTARGTAEELLRLNPESDGARRLLARLNERSTPP